MKVFIRLLTIAVCLALLQPASAGSATVKPLEVFSEKILVLEIEYFATDHILTSTQLRRSVERLNREMNIMSQKNARDSGRLLTGVAEKLAAAVGSSRALSSYLSVNSSRLKDSGHGRYLPLAGMDREIETPYYTALTAFLKTAGSLVQYCEDNFEGISSGRKEELRRYEEIYAAYLRDMESFNSRSVIRSRMLAEMGSEYPFLWELMPR